jgi:hypothetical protein
MSPIEPGHEPLTAPHTFWVVLSALRGLQHSRPAVQSGSAEQELL